MLSSWPKDISDVIRILRWGDVTTRVLKLENVMAVAREKDVMIGTGKKVSKVKYYKLWRWRKGPLARGILQKLANGSKQGNRPVRASRRKAVCWPPDFRPVRPMSDFRATVQQDDRLALLTAMFWQAQTSRAGHMEAAPGRSKGWFLEFRPVSHVLWWH